MLKDIKKIKKVYLQIAIILLNLIIIFILINLFLFIFNPILKQFFVKGASTYPKEILKEAYPELEISESRLLIEETRQKLSYDYDPFSGYKLNPFSGKYLKISKNGFRFVENQCDYPIDNSNYNIFIFGGSTSFGSGAMDKDTIASKIQEKLRQKYHNKICVYNFARPAFYSSQERALFLSLISEKAIKPDMAIFIDGLNEHRTTQDNAQRMSNFMLGKGKISYLLSELPLTEVIDCIYRKITSDSERLMGPDVETIYNRYIENKNILKSISKQQGIKTYFVIHPIPMYKYNISNHILVKHNFVPDFYKDVNLMQSAYFYEKMAANNITEEENLIWLADIQENRNENLYVDSAHYTAKFSEELAEEIVNSISLSD